jgi:hypothetical protein
MKKVSVISQFTNYDPKRGFADEIALIVGESRGATPGLKPRALAV